MRYHFLFALLICALLNAHGKIYDVTDYGAVGDGVTDNAPALQSVIDLCSSEGGGTVLFPSAGVFMSGPLCLKSNVNIHMESNSTLIANPDESVYELSAFKDNRGEGMMWLWGKDIENFSISGTGRIDGNAVAFMGSELDDSFELKPVTDFDPRPHLLTIIGGRKINISDVTVSNSAYWTIHLIGCYDVAVSDISLLNNLKVRNGDGIDIDHSRKVRITGCFIESGDDCICLKNRREWEEYGPCEDIVVTNCIMTSRSCAVKIGSENMDSISRVLFDNCIITDSNRGIGIQNRDEGTVTDVTFSNMIVGCHLYSDVWWGKSEPIYVTSYPRAVGNHKDAGWRFPKGATEGRCGKIDNIRFINISATTENGIFLGCDVPGKISRISFDNVSLDFREQTSFPGGVYDRRPCTGEGFVSAPAFGIYAENVNGIKVRDFSVDVAGFPTARYGGKYHFTDCIGISGVPVAMNVPSAMRDEWMVASRHGDLRKELAGNPRKSGGIYYAYPVTSDSIAEAPAGYVPVYVSHYGRHGSRWAINLTQYDEVDSVFNIEAKAGNLTPLGLELKRLCMLAGAHARGHSGELSPLGERQHRDIASRMSERFPGLFTPGAVIEAFSSVEPRCIVSMAAFCESLKEAEPSLMIRRHASPGDMDFIAYSTPEAKAQGSLSAPWRLEFGERYDSLTLCDATARKIFIEPSRLDNQPRMMRKLHDVAIALQDVDGIDFDFLDVFEPEDLYNLWQAGNHIMYYRHALAAGNDSHGVRSATSLLSRLIAESDSALTDMTSPRVNLHFGHDTNLIRLLALMDLKGCAESVADPDGYADAWQAFRVSPMAANLQMAFYAPESGVADDVIVALRHNEHPAYVAGVDQMAPGFYSWPRLRKYWVDRMSAFSDDNLSANAKLVVSNSL